MIHARPDYQRFQDPENKIPADEPVFLLRAQDKTAAEVVEYWVRLNADRFGESEAVRLARAHVQRIRDWPVKKVADV